MPLYTHSNVVTYLAAPPYHRAFEDCYNGNPFVQWTSLSSKTTLITVKSQQTWTVSDTFKMSAEFGLNSILGGSASQTFKKQTQKIVENEYQAQVTVSKELKIESFFDEVLVARRITYQITELPVYIGLKLSGHVIIIQPMDKDSNTLYVTVGSRVYYNSTIVSGDVRTYPANEPENMDYTIYTVSGTVAVGSSFEYTVTSELMKGHQHALSREQNTQVDTDIDVKFPFDQEGVSGSLGVSFSHSDSYTSTHVKTTQMQITSRIEIILSIPGYQDMNDCNSLQYDVTPYIYWDYEGHLHISWSVIIPKLEWDRYIQHPDPALRLPYSKSEDSPVSKYMTFELVTTPRSIPNEGESILIKTVVHNYSFRQAMQIEVQFYWTDTSEIPPNRTHIFKWHNISNRTIPIIGGFSEESTFISWYPPKGRKSALLIVQLESPNKDFDPSNNFGYSVWPQDAKNPLRMKQLLQQSGKCSDNVHICKL